MAERIAIEWCDATLNLWWGCTKVSDGCKHCYAETLTNRYGHDNWGPNGTRREVKSWRSALKKISRRAKAEGRRLRVFVQSMSDTFEGPETMGGRKSQNWDTVTRLQLELFAAMESHPELDFLLLTKRPENVVQQINDALGEVSPAVFAPSWCEYPHLLATFLKDWIKGKAPSNVWIGTSVEDQKTADERIPYLLKIPAAVRFLSCEPLLGTIDLTPYIGYPAINGEVPKQGGLCIPGGGGRAADDRYTGSRLEGGRGQGEQVESLDDHARSASAQGRALGDEVSPSSLDDPRGSTSCLGPSTGMAPLSRPDSRGYDGQPQERNQDGQPAGESGVGYGQRSEPAYDDRTREEVPGGGTKQLSEALGGPSAGDPCPTGTGRETDRDRRGFRGVVPNDQQDREPHKSSPIAWIIVGGESGPHARPMHPDWARSIRDQCQAASVPFFFKQWGSHGAGALTMDKGEPVFRTFRDHGQWVAKAQTWVNGGTCVDLGGKVLAKGSDFESARYPVAVVHRMDKKRAGRLLDGREWSQFPEVAV